MLEPVSVFDIPLLLDTICAMLDPRDIGNCATCSKEWHSFFGPYRFRSVNITRSDAAKNAFLLNNSHHIRDLTINLGHFDTFVNPNCNGLQNLTLGFIYEANEESDCDDDDPDDTGLDGPDISDPSVPMNKRACAAKLIQRSTGLRTLHLSNAGIRSPFACGSSIKEYYRHVRPVTKPILEAIGNHTFLTKIEVTLYTTCRMYSILLNHLPQQLQELSVSHPSESVRNHRRCNRQTRLFRSRTSILGIQRLNLRSIPECLSIETLMHLLKRCRELGELELPMWDIQDNTDTMAGIVQVLDSNCQRLHTLNQETRLSMLQIGVLLKGFSKGFRQLCMPYVGFSHDAEWANKSLLETLLTTASVNTIEVLKCNSNAGSAENTIEILKHCTQLRVFRALGDEVDLSDLLLSMDETWGCWSTLEELELWIANERVAMEQTDAEAKRRRTAQDVRELYLRWRSFPKLTTLDIKWNLKTGWDQESYDLGYDQEKYGMALTLDDFNDGAAKSGSVTMTIEDAAWVGLKLD
ncbi:hypothetical protein BGX34_007492 [Mortierella sp. NVP85]|nr:hypothetical protein BGX34_007492 [Mortierella sp. NVP85]